MEEMNKTVLVNTEIENKEAENGDIDKLYLELGKAYYEGAFEDPLPQLLPIFDKLTAAIKKQGKEAVSITQDISKNSVPQICRGCGAELLENARFCGICGMELETQAVLQEEQKSCKMCGSLLDKDAAFCGNCGAQVES